MYKNLLKRILDILLSAFGILLFSPVLIVVILILIVVNNGSPFFFQERPGKDGNPFRIVKFKTMRDIKSTKSDDLHNMARVTKVGGFLRKYSVDEIPQLFNVLNGDMSIIGPRPLLTQYVPLYNERQRKRLGVKPGVTGWAQVNGRNAISWGQKFELDVYYVENLSFALDVKILIKTVQKVLQREGINSGSEGEKEVIMPEWKGNNN
ncbi:sugar transferase [Hyunsoonleella rubra]|uniref:Sugar transferase n=1 Tax=Hyunsoonleella rubra TaxID=1737062 RepID=A0ABW5T9W4_9FLAO